MLNILLLLQGIVITIFKVYDTTINMNRLLLHLLIIYDITNIHLHQRLMTMRLVSKTVRMRKVTNILFTKNYQILLFFCKFVIIYICYIVFQANMLQKVILIFLICVLQFQFYHSRYVLIDVYDQDDGPRAPGCGDWCWQNCTKDPRCPHCVWLHCREHNV